MLARPPASWEIYLIATHRYSWEKREKSRKKPWFRRIWFLASIFLMVACGLAALAAYAFIVSEFSAKADSFDLEKMGRMESSSIIYDRSDRQMGKIFIQNRVPIPFEKIPKEMVNAIVAEEDNRFFEHHGVDYFGILRAAISNYRQGRVKQGASTCLLYTSPSPRDRQKSRMPSSA